MQNKEVQILSVPRSKSMWDEGCMVLLLVLSAAQIAYAFGATAGLFEPVPKEASAGHLMKHVTLLARR